MRVIFSCSCGNTDEFAKDAFKILFPKEELPELVAGRVMAKSLSQKLPDFRDEIMALHNSNEPFAYYIDTETKEMWDLLKGVRVQ